MKKRRLTKRMINEIEHLLNRGMTKRQISQYLGGYDTWLQSLLNTHDYHILAKYQLVPRLAQKNKKKVGDSEK